MGTQTNKFYFLFQMYMIIIAMIHSALCGVKSYNFVFITLLWHIDKTDEGYSLLIPVFTFLLFSHVESCVLTYVVFFCSGRSHSLPSVRRNSALRPVTITAVNCVDREDGTVLRTRLQTHHTSLLVMR